MNIDLHKERFLNKAIQKHGNRYDYSHVNYIKSSIHVDIVCDIHGIFSQTPANHLAGNGCPICNPFFRPVSNCDFISRVSALLPDIEILEEYISYESYIRVADKFGIVYRVKSGNLINGTRPTIASAVDKDFAFEIKSRLVHGNKYTYDKSRYTRNRDKITITCPDHGDFECIAANHIAGRGCKLCRNEIISTLRGNDPLGWSLSNWIKTAEASSRFDSYKLYIIECIDKDESFIKIGRTFNTVEVRFNNRLALPYDYTILKIIEGNAYKIFNLENKLKRKYKEYKYFPIKDFAGKHECFRIDIKKLIETI